MRYMDFARTGEQVPVIGQGTWMMGDDPASFHQEVEALRAGIEAGMTLIDTAEMYAGGGAERVVAEAIKDCRDEIFLVTKVWPTNASYDGVTRSAAGSLRRLKVDRVDLYLLHWPSETYPVRDTMRALERLVQDGSVRYIGVSNFSPELIEEAQAALRSSAIACNQVVYHLKNRIIEKAVLPYCTERGIAVMGYSPFGQQNFPEPGTPGRQLLDRIAMKYGKTPYQIALNWLIERKNVLAIPKAARRQHALENATAADFTLAPEDSAAIDRAFPVPPGDFPVKRL